MRIGMVGAGYVGLVSGACFSEFGIDVVCVDRDPARIRQLRGGDIPIYEPGLEALIESNVNAGRLSFSTDIEDAVTGSEAVFIAVGTPGRHGDGRADLRNVRQAAEEVARAMDGGYKVDRDEIDRPGRHWPRDRRAHREALARPGRSTSHPTPSSCARARRSGISCAPTGW